MPARMLLKTTRPCPCPACIYNSRFLPGAILPCDLSYSLPHFSSEALRTSSNFSVHYSYSSPTPSSPVSRSLLPSTTFSVDTRLFLCPSRYLSDPLHSIRSITSSYQRGVFLWSNAFQNMESSLPRVRRFCERIEPVHARAPSYLKGVVRKRYTSNGTCAARSMTSREICATHILKASTFPNDC